MFSRYFDENETNKRDSFCSMNSEELEEMLQAEIKEKNAAFDKAQTTSESTTADKSSQKQQWFNHNTGNNNQDTSACSLLKEGKQNKEADEDDEEDVVDTYMKKYFEEQKAAELERRRQLDEITIESRNRRKKEQQRLCYSCSRLKWGNITLLAMSVLCCVLFFALAVFFSTEYSLRSHRMKTVSATVVGNPMFQFYKSNTVTMYYEFEYEGTLYSGVDYEKFTLRVSALEFAKQKTVKVYYDPEDPNRNGFDRRVGLEGWIAGIVLFWVGLVCIICSIIIICWRSVHIS